MATYTVDLSDIADASAQLQAVTARLEQAMSDLQTKVNQFVVENKGQAIDNYGEVQQKWNQGLHQVREGTAQATDVLRMIGENYEAGDRHGAALFVA
ncbi:WXG100 family type VII secretion target [Dactylosporangium darangshiense]|uniref:ESAT-6-like protein n=1 Tax=Dactylosporangium darangshiense TaxID=579108 RepID=A0ABP8DVZ0_9ACTN